MFLLKYGVIDETFKLKTEYKVSPDQSKVISSLTENFQNGKQKQVLLGVTGSGKTFVMANLIEKLQAVSW